MSTHKEALEKIRAALAKEFPEPYLATAPDDHLAPWIWRQCDAALAVYSTASGSLAGPPDEAAVERERCAKIAEAMSLCQGICFHERCRVLKRVVATIRSAK